MATKTKTTYSVTLLNGEVITFASTLSLAWAVVTEECEDRAWMPSRFGIYARSASRQAAAKKRDEAASIPAPQGFAQVALVPVTVVS
jgi:hypothetical protein